MKSQLLNPIMQILITALVGVITVLIKNVGDIVIQYLKKEKEIIEQKLKLSKHTEELNTAREVWNIVEEKYRITNNIEKLANSKADEFDKLLLSKFPYLTQNEITEIRQALAGEFNKGKKMLNEESLKKQADEIIDKNNKLENENEQLKNKLNTISNCIPKQE